MSSLTIDAGEAEGQKCIACSALSMFVMQTVLGLAYGAPSLLDNTADDAESENNRLKKWSRTRYGKLQLNASEMDEYVFYVNVGSSMCDVFHGLAMANGGACSNRLLAIE